MKEPSPATHALPKGQLLHPEYAALASPHDELAPHHLAARGPGHALRPHWQQLMAILEEVGGGELERRRQEAWQVLRENGVTYNVYNEQDSKRRLWEIDPVPLVISADEWSRTERGLVQRAELLNLVLQDLYGPRQLLREGALPAELIYAHPGFLRPCQGLQPNSTHPLIQYAVDLARGPDDRMWVLSDRTQAPSGPGYALETRIAMSQVLPDTFKRCYVQRLSGFFRTLRDTLAAQAPHLTDDPRIVVLTPGPLNETYFEQAYLAAYLGYSLVQGDDLTVRDGQLWMKSLEGLQRVDVVLRRVDDTYCDPLELRGDSQLGVPGLLEAARRGTVLVANPLGSGVLENPGLLPFLPGLCRLLLGEDLQLPSAATWWCGQPDECRYVLDHLSDLVIKPVHRSGLSVFGPELSRPQRDVWRARIQKSPALYVGQELVEFSTTPALIDGTLQPRRSVTRHFLVTSEGGYRVMPGGLTRVAPGSNTLSITNQAGSVNKDTWVLAEHSQPHRSLLSDGARTIRALDRSGVLPSRAGENLFWVGRYAERAEFTVRMLRTVLNKHNEIEEYGDDNDRRCLTSLIDALRAVTHADANSIPATQGAEPPQTDLASLIADPARFGSLSQVLSALTHAAFNVRDLWSSDTWRVIDDLEALQEGLQGLSVFGGHRLRQRLDDLVTSLIALSGQTTESMTHEHGWTLLDTGRRLERALGLCDLLRTAVVPVHEELLDHLVLEAVLSSQESLMIHRWRYRTAPHKLTALDLLLLDESNPRGLVYQLKSIDQHLTTLPDAKNNRLEPVQRIALGAYTRVRLTESTVLVEPKAGRLEALESLLLATHVDLQQFSAALAERYFSHVQAPRQLGTTSLGIDP